MLYVQDVQEHINCLQINPVMEQVIYSVKLPEIKQNDVLHITAELEATNNLPFNVMVGSKIILAKNNKSTKGILIDSANGFNITPNMHHGVLSKSRNWQSPSSYNEKYVNVVVWAISENAIQLNKLKIEHGYGHLDIVIYKKQGDS